MNNNAEKNQGMTVEEFVAELKRLKVQTEDKLADAIDKMAEIEDAEPDCDGAKYERWQDKYDRQQMIIDCFEDNLEKINSYLEEYDTSEV